MDKGSLLSRVLEKNKRIEELERLVEEQRRLRLQDASQVEEKAARIKEWVANKLKELENQNKLLRDQNKKQKEIIELLNKQISNSTPKKINLHVVNQPVERESPVYDTVNIDITASSQQQQAPPPPLHQSDKWELQLYNLADQTLSNIMKQSEEDNDSSYSRKSSLSSKNDLILLVKPSFTTIYGDNVVDSFDFDQEEEEKFVNHEEQNQKECSEKQNEQSSQQSSQANKIRKESIDSCDNSDKLLTPNLFDSPMRSKSRKDNILRTQSVRKNPTPGRLYDFILADLVKRGYLVKPGALKNHNRWFVLRNFHLYSYKSETEETLKATPNFKIRLDLNCQVHLLNQSSESNFPFRITYLDKTLQLNANTAQSRDDWIKILTVTINMSDIEPDNLTKNNSIYDGIMSMTRHGHSKRCYATLINHVVFFLKSLTDPTPMSYISVKEARIREITDSYDYDLGEQELLKQKTSIQNCSLAIYPKFCMTNDPVYITLGSQQETDKWLYFLSRASGLDQSYGTHFEQTLSKIMINNSIANINNNDSLFGSQTIGCLWREHSLMLYSDKPIDKPLTTLPNETLKTEAVELFKSILLFTQVSLEPIAIDYHVSLLKNCLNQLLKHPELRNEFYAQLIKQSTWVIHRCESLSSDGSECSPTNCRSSFSSSTSPNYTECQFLTDVRQLDSANYPRSVRYNSSSTSSQSNNLREKNKSSVEGANPPTQSELFQVMQILAIAVSLNLPRGRMRWWLVDHLRKFAHLDTNIGKYALYTLRAIDRTEENGARENLPSRTEIMSILLRNPYDHSNPHSLPINFSDGSYLVIGADGSTTVEEFMSSMTKDINIRHSMLSDFHLFVDDPSGSKDLHILEPKRKILDIVGWWEETCRLRNSGRYQNTKFIRLMCKKRLVLKKETDETDQERLLIVHQANQEVVSQNIPLSESLALELGAIMAQLTFGNLDTLKDSKMNSNKILTTFLPKRTSQIGGDEGVENEEIYYQLLNRWRHLEGKSTSYCVRVYLNCIRRLNLNQ